jgi:hypothetical protein
MTHGRRASSHGDFLSERRELHLKSAAERVETPTQRPP